MTNDISPIKGIQEHFIVSNLIPLYRELPDIRPDYCRTVEYSKNLPVTSVIMIFHNEVCKLMHYVTKLKFTTYSFVAFFDDNALRFCCFQTNSRKFTRRSCFGWRLLGQRFKKFSKFFQDSTNFSFKINSKNRWKISFAPITLKSNLFGRRSEWD